MLKQEMHQWPLGQISMGWWVRWRFETPWELSIYPGGKKIPENALNNKFQC